MNKSNLTPVLWPLILLLVIASSANALTAILAPTDDAYVDSLKNNINFANDELAVGDMYYNNPCKICRTYVKFDLASLGSNITISSAKLFLRSHSISQPPYAIVGAHYLTDNSWDENTITWDNAPTTFSPFATDFETVANSTTWYSWNVTASAQAASTTGTLSEVMICTTEGQSHSWSTFEAQNADLPPYLLVEYKENQPDPTIKWSQPPVQEEPGIFIGWDEESHNLAPRMVADDFRCSSDLPVIGIRWWGSFINWQQDKLPDLSQMPKAFYMTIWTDVPADADNPYSHPDKIIWEHYCYNFNAHFVGWEKDPKNPDTLFSKFEFTQYLNPEEYWYQPGEEGIYWLGIMAIYGNPDIVAYPWGWETREHFFNDDAVRFFDFPLFGVPYPGDAFEPIEFNEVSWDLSFELISIPNEPPNPDPSADLGDAPDSSNNTSSIMTTFPSAVQANYPTVYNDGSAIGPYGPIHLEPKIVAYLGKQVSLENEADLGPDEDPNNNILPASNTPDQESADDCVVSMPLNIPHNIPTKFKYWVTIVNPTYDMYANVWFDWNRDGDWNDTLTAFGGLCPEWAVQNQLISGLPIGMHTVVTPLFRPWHPAPTIFTHILKPPYIWMRITLSEEPVTFDQDLDTGGEGPASGYRFGETEDYYFRPKSKINVISADPIAIWRSGDINGDRIVDFNDFSYFAQYWLQDPNRP